MLFDPPPAHILYCYGELNRAVLGLKQRGVEIFQGVPDRATIMERPKPLLLVLDDLMMDVVKGGGGGAGSDYLDNLFTRGSHNWNVSVVFVTQSLYGKNIRTVRANSHYIILMRDRSGILQIRTLGMQLFPRSLPYFMDSYNGATEKQFSYLLINMHPAAEEEYRLVSRIFPDDKPAMEVYLPAGAAAAAGQKGI